MRFLLIPGAGGSAWYWHRVVPLLLASGHQAVAVDLPGADPAFGLPEYVDLATAAAGQLSPEGELVVVGQSLAGFSAPLVAERLRAAGSVQVELILVNAMIPALGETAGEWWASSGQQQAMEAEDVRAGRRPGGSPGGPGFDEAAYFLHDLPSDVLAEAGRHVRPQSGTVFGAPFPMAWPHVATRVISGRADRFFPVDFQRRLARERLGLAVEEVPGGHLVALARPVELVEALLDDGSRGRDAASSPGPA